MRGPAVVAIFAAQLAVFAFAQSAPVIPALKSGVAADVLFVADVPASGERDDAGKPALASVEPVVFVTSNGLRDCAEVPKKPDYPAVPKIVIDKLSALYSPGHRFPVWYGGRPYGMLEAVKSCIDDDYQDFDGCVSLAKGTKEPRKRFKGLSWTGATLEPTHAFVRAAASSEERAAFLQSASAEYKTHFVTVAPTSIHSTTVQEIQLRADRTALVGSTLVQLASTKPNTYYSYRLFLVVEQRDGNYVPVLRHFRRTTLSIESDAYAPKRDATLDEEGETDRETFVDSIPLFADEPDAVVTQHKYYESWAYSLYRFMNGEYRLLYTGCGGGV